MYQPPKFNMEPENDGFQEELAFLGLSMHLFSGSMLNFGGVCGPQNSPRTTEVLSRRKAKLDTQPSRPSGHSATSSCEDTGSIHQDTN